MPNDSVIGAFSAEYAAKITGLTARQLAYWNNSGFFKPSIFMGADSERPLQIYSFNDLVGLRVIAVLIKIHKISLRTLRKVAEQLEKFSKTPWSNLKIMVCNKEVSFINPTTGLGQGALTKQGVFVEIIDEIKNVSEAAKRLNKRTDDQIGVIEKHRNVVHNVPVFAGTRVPVRAVKRFLDAGYSPSQILEEYPSLNLADIESVQHELSGRDAA